MVKILKIGLFIPLLYPGILFSCDSKTAYMPLPVKEDRIVIDIERLQEKRPEFFSATIHKKRIGFFILKIGESVESYLDACMKCYPNRMGYRAGDSYLECRYCNVRYQVDSLKTGIGSCYPIPIQGRLKGREYIIDIDHLKEAEKFF